MSPASPATGAVAEPVEAPRAVEHPLLDLVREHPAISTYLELADEFMDALGYTEHGMRHANLVSAIAYNVLDRLGFDAHEAELAAVAGYLHDVGNVVSRHDHPQSSALLALPVLTDRGFAPRDIAFILSAVGNHEEELGHAVSPVSAAVVLADKSDVHRSRVRKNAQVGFDIHDRVNYSATRSFLRVDADARTITLELEIDTTISDVLEYFEIFLLRMMMCRRAAEGLECRFAMTVNGASLL